MFTSQMLMLALVATVLPIAIVGKQMDAEANPIRKVVNMLKDMEKELQEEADAEKETFDKAMCLCKAGKKELSNVIMTATADHCQTTAGMM